MISSKKRETFLFGNVARSGHGDDSRVDTGVDVGETKVKIGKSKDHEHVSHLLVRPEIQGTILLRVLDFHSGIVEKLQVVVRTTSNSII